MKHLKVMLVAALFAAPLATFAQEAQKVTFDVSGTLILNGFMNRGELDGREQPKFAKVNDPVYDQRYMGLAARASRLRAAIGIPADGLLGGATLKGLVEADFGGGAGATADTVIPRMRHYYVAANWKQLNNFSLLIGQTWGVAANVVFAESNAHYLVPRFGGAGVLFRRAPQIRASADVPAGPLALTATVAALMPGDAGTNANAGTGAPTLNQSAGNDSGMPNFESRLAAKYSQGGKPMVEAGLWAHYGLERYDNLVAGKDVTAKSSVIGLDLRLTLPFVTVLGNIYQGENLDVMNAVAGTFVTTTPAAYKNGVLIDATTDPANPKARGIKTQGAFVQAVVSPVKRVQLLLGVGTENPDNDTLHLGPSTASVPTGAITRNTQYSAGTILQVASRWKVSLEATRYLTTVSNTADPKDGRDVLPSTQFEVGSAIAF